MGLQLSSTTARFTSSTECHSSAHNTGIRENFHHGYSGSQLSYRLQMRVQGRKEAVRSVRRGTKTQGKLMKEILRLCPTPSLCSGELERNLGGAAVFRDLLLFGLEMRPQTSREAVSVSVTFSVEPGWPLF